MSQSAFHKRVQPFSPSVVSYLRTRMCCGLAPPLLGAVVPPFQGLLMFSLMYAAGAQPEELIKMRVECLLDADGNPSSQVRFEPSVTKHWTTRAVPMHPDVREDLVRFREFFPTEHWIVFRNEPGDPHQAPITASALTAWFRQFLREANLGQFSIRSGRKTFLEIKRRAA